MCIIISYDTHTESVTMKQESKTRKQFILPPAKIKKAKDILSTKTDTETVERALDLVIADDKIPKALLAVKGTCNIEDAYGRLRR